MASGVSLPLSRIQSDCSKMLQPPDIFRIFLLLSSLVLSPTMATTCYCHGHCPNNALNGTCEAPPGAPCFAAVEEVVDPHTGALVPERTYGCLPPDEQGLMQCKGHLVPHFQPRTIACCAERALCNQDLAPMYQPTRDSAAGAGDQLDPSVYHVALLVSLTVCLVIFILLVTFAYLRYKHREDRRQRYMAESGVSSSSR